MTVKEVQSMTWDEINSLSLKELRKVTRVVADVANKRLQRLEKNVNDFIAKDAYNSISKSGGKIYTKGLSYNKLRGELVRGLNFLSFKTSTIKEAERVYNAREKSLFGDITQDLALKEYRREQSKKIGDLYDKFTEMVPQIYNTMGVREGIEMASEYVKNNPEKSVDELLEDMYDEYEKKYKEKNDGEDYNWGQGG